jgi:hypothetical protein
MIVARPRACTRILAATLAATLALQPLAVNAAAILETLAEVPIQGLNPVKPNIMFTMDDSGSMGWDFLPDYVAGSQRHRALPRRHPVRRCDVAPGGGYTFSQYDPPVRSANYNAAFYDPSAFYRAGKKSDGTDLPCEGSDTTCGAPWTAVYQNGFANYPGSNTGGTIDLTTGYPDSVWCWKSSTTTTEKQTADSNGSVCRRNGRTYTSATVSGNTTPAITAGYNYPNASATCVGSEKCKFIYEFSLNGNPYYYRISQVQFCSNKDAAGWGTSPCASQWDPTTYRYVRYGTGAATFDPQAFTRCRHQAVRIPGQRRLGGEPERPHLRAGDGELRQLVCVLPHADPVDESGVRHRVLGARPELARRLPHAVGERHAVHERQGLHRRQQADLVHERLQGQPERRHSAARRHVARRRAVRRQPRRQRPHRGNRSARPRDRQMPAEFPSAVDRRLLEQHAVVHVARQQRRDGAVACQPSRRNGIHAGPALPPPVRRDVARDQQQPRRPRDVLLDPRPAADDRGQGEGLERAVAARQHLRIVDRRQGHDQLPERDQRHRFRHRDVAAGYRARAAPKRSTTCGTRRSTAAASSSTRAMRSSWPKASSRRSPTSPTSPAPARPSAWVARN